MTRTSSKCGRNFVAVLRFRVIPSRLLSVTSCLRLRVTNEEGWIEPFTRKAGSCKAPEECGGARRACNVDACNTKSGLSDFLPLEEIELLMMVDR